MMKTFGFQNSPNPYDEEDVKECKDCAVKENCPRLKGKRCWCECHWTEAEKRTQARLEMGDF